MIVFRTNAGQEGLGHINRIFSLYQKMREIKNDIQYLFLVNSVAENYLLEKDVSPKNIMILEDYQSTEINLIKEKKPKLFILDTYKAHTDYIHKLKKAGIKTALFIDTLEYKDIHVDILINGNIYANCEDYKKELIENKISYDKGFLGTDFIILNPTIKSIKKTNIEEKQITITTGGSDPNNFMPILMKNIKIKEYKRNIIIGPFFNQNQINEIETLKEKNDILYHAPKSLNKIIAESRLIISSAGSTVYEIIFHKKPFALFKTGNDQRMIINYFKQKGITIIDLKNADNPIDIKMNKLLDIDYANKCKSFKEITKKSTKRLAQNLLKEIT